MPLSIRHVWTRPVSCIFVNKWLNISIIQVLAIIISYHWSYHYQPIIFKIIHAIIAAIVIALVETYEPTSCWSATSLYKPLCFSATKFPCWDTFQPPIAGLSWGTWIEDRNGQAIQLLLVPPLLLLQKGVMCKHEAERACHAPQWEWEL